MDNTKSISDKRKKYILKYMRINIFVIQRILSSNWKENPHNVKKYLQITYLIRDWYPKQQQQQQKTQCNSKIINNNTTRKWAGVLKRNFFKEEIQIANKQIKRSLAPLSFR